MLPHDFFVFVKDVKIAFLKRRLIKIVPATCNLFLHAASYLQLQLRNNDKTKQLTKIKSKTIKT
jgi:hypothetical protein